MMPRKPESEPRANADTAVPSGIPNTRVVIKNAAMTP
jgi:hypothetical protein